MSLFKTTTLGFYSKQAKEQFAADRADEFTKFNLEIAQLTNTANLMVMLDYISEIKDDHTRKNLEGFVLKLNRNADKINDAVKRVEDKINYDGVIKVKKETF